MNYKTKRILKTIALVLVGALLGGAIIGFTDIGEKLQPTRNDENFIVVNDTYVKDGTNDKGVTWKVSDDGTIKLSGKSTSADSIVVQNVALKAGTYTYSVGNDKVNVDKYYSYVDANGEHYIAGTTNDTFELVEDTTVQVVICWLEKVSFGEIIGTTFRPIIVEGENPGDFYAK